MTTHHPSRPAPRLLLDAEALSRTLSRIAHELIERNPDLEDSPGLVNEAAESGAWFFKLRLADKGELEGLMDAEAYAAFVETLS